MLFPYCGRRGMRIGLSCMLLLWFVAASNADPKPLSKEEQAKVDKAVAKGVAYLKRIQARSGHFPRDFQGKIPGNFRFIIGHTLVPALALLECGVPSDDPALKKVTALLRKSTGKLDSTYELSLAILYLDKLGERQDEEIIRSLALRLVAGQSYTGGWCYHCPRLKPEQETDLLEALRTLQEALAKQGPPQGAKRGDEAVPEVPASLGKLAVFQKPENLFERKELTGGDRDILYVGWTDNSNTQFAMLGLWAAYRHKLPLEPTFHLLVRRFECTQGDDGTWDYRYQFGGRREDRRYYLSDTGVGLLALAIGRSTLSATKETQARREKQIINGLAALSRDIGAPAEQRMREGGRQPDYYFLWTIERVGALYKLPAFGEKDWYRWGTAILLKSQLTEGAWFFAPGYGLIDSYGHSLNTAFALLFLKRSNLTNDLTARLPLKPNDLNKGILALTGDDKDSASAGSAATKNPSAQPPR